MLDIIALIFLTMQIGNIALTKGVKPGTWKLYTVLAWFGGEILGMVFYFFAFGGDRMFIMYLMAIPFGFGGYYLVRSILSHKPDVYNEEINQIGEHLVQ